MLTISLCLIVLIIFLWLRWRKKTFSVLKDLGIPGPEPSIIFGNYFDLARKTHLECHKEWSTRYGKIYGYYYGHRPIVVVSDIELLKKIQISEFQKFMNRPLLFGFMNFIAKPGDGLATQLINLRGLKWKEVRSTITPTFTTSKIKQMTPIMNNAIDTLLEIIDGHAQKDETFNIDPLYHSLTMDIIGRTAFGIQTDCQRNPDDPFLKAATMIALMDSTSFFFFLASCFPELNILLGLLVFLVLYFGKSPFKHLTNSVKQVIDFRRKNPSSKRQDLLQLLLDSEGGDTDDANMKDLTAGQDSAHTVSENKDIIGKSRMGSGRHLSEGEIIDNAIQFILAGYETTSTALAFATHLLIHHPEVQEKVRAEVNDLIEREGKLDYNAVQKLRYLDQVMSESLRIYPPVFFFVTREVGEDVDLGPFRIKKNMAVEVPVYSMQHDEKLWPDPEVFDPDRFSPENKSRINPMAFQTFGNGPRNCVGMRFAQMEFKLALARILHKYRLSSCDETDGYPVTLRENFVNLVPGKGVHLRAQLLKPN